jgi:hypothetical protein
MFRRDLFEFNNGRDRSPQRSFREARPEDVLTDQRLDLFHPSLLATPWAICGEMALPYFFEKFGFFPNATSLTIFPRIKCSWIILSRFSGVHV